jgi:hypothetical protein
MSLCPSPETLGRLAQIAAGDPGFVAVEAHIEECAACQRRLERLAADGSTRSVRESAQVPLRDQPPEISGFVIEGEIGRGGMGVVYQARQLGVNRRVAIKFVSSGIGTAPEQRRRWLREARAVGRVRHRNVVPIHQAGEQDGLLYLVLDLVPGGSLAERLTGPLPARVAVELTVGVARAVDHLHRLGIIHLDVKPSNILLDGPPGAPWDEVVPMITDFGIARAGDDPDATASTLIAGQGTPSYMAPEQVVGNPATVGPRADVFALGATFYRLLTGRPPFEAASVIETLDLVRHAEPAPPRSLVPGLPRDLETIVLTCLRKDQAQRYASAAALAEDLERWLDGFPIRARPISMLERTVRWCRRRPALALLLAVLAITVASSLVGLFTLWRRSEGQRARAEDALGRAVASEKSAAGAVGELVGLLSRSVGTPEVMAAERMDNLVAVVRDLTARLGREPAFGAANLTAILDVTVLLSADLRRRSKFDQSDALLKDTLQLLESRRMAGAGDPAVDEAYCRTLLELAKVTEDQGHDDETLARYQRAEQIAAGMAHDPPLPSVILTLYRARRQIAAYWYRRGRTADAQRLLETNARALDRMSARARGASWVRLVAALARLELGADDAAVAALAAALRTFPVGQRLPTPLEERLSEWICGDIAASFCVPGAGDPSDLRDPESRAAATIAALDARCDHLGVPRGVFAVTARRLGMITACHVMDLRKAGRLNDARRTLAYLSALARRLERRDPAELEFHLILQEAFVQESKIAKIDQDVPRAEAALHKALAEACTAVRLDPGNMDARQMVTGALDKLIALAREQPRAP